MIVQLPRTLMHYTTTIVLCLLFFKPFALADDSESRKSLEALRKEVKAFTLNNGMRVTLYKRSVAPVFSSVVAVRVGGVDEMPGKTGISHLLEHMAFKGTKTIGTTNYEKEALLLKEQESLMIKKDSGALTPIESKRLKQVERELSSIWKTAEFTDLIEKNGGVSLNASTDKEFTKYYVSLPTNAFEYWCWLESERILNPVFREFFKERDVVMEERRMRYEDSHWGKLYENLLNVAFDRHPYKHPVIGYADDISGLLPSELKTFHEKYYVGKNISISVVGDIDPTAAIKTIKTYFERIPMGGPLERPTVTDITSKAQKYVKVEMDKSPLMFISYHKPVFPAPDDAPITVMSEILSGSRSARLQEHLLKRKRLVSDVSYMEGPGFAYPNLFSFLLTPQQGISPERVNKEFDIIVDNFIKEEITTRELKKAKRALAMEYVVDMTSNMSLAKNFATSHMLYGDWSAFLDWYTQMQKVTVKDVKDVAKRYLKDSNRVVGVVVRPRK